MDWRQAEEAKAEGSGWPDSCGHSGLQSTGIVHFQNSLEIDTVENSGARLLLWLESFGWAESGFYIVWFWDSEASCFALVCEPIEQSSLRLAAIGLAIFAVSDGDSARVFEQVSVLVRAHFPSWIGEQ